MKVKTYLAVALLSGVLAVTAMPVQSAIAMPAMISDVAWTATDPNIFIVDFSAGANGFFFLYDKAGDGPTDNLNVFAKNPMFTDVYFTTDANNVLHASLTDNDTSSSSVALAGTSFGFFFSNEADGSNPTFSYNVQELGTTSYRLTSNSGPGMSVIIHDVAPVPLPAAFWILGSGFAALVGMKKKKRA